MSRETVHVGVYDTLADWEVGLAIAHINNPQFQREPGRYRVVTVGESREPVTTIGGIRILPDMTLDELDPSDSAMLVLPGAERWETDRNGAFGKKAREFVDARVPVAAICGATAGLAREGLLDNRDHTSNAPEYLAATGYQGGGRYRDEPAVTDRNVITASGVAPAEFAREVFARLDVYEPQILHAWYRLYGKQDATAFGSLMTESAESET